MSFRSIWSDPCCWNRVIANLILGKKCNLLDLVCVNCGLQAQSRLKKAQWFITCDVLILCVKELGARGPSVQHLPVPWGSAEDVLRAVQQLRPAGHDQPPDQSLHPEGAFAELRPLRGGQWDVLRRVQTLPAERSRRFHGDLHLTSDQADNKVWLVTYRHSLKSSLTKKASSSMSYEIIPYSCTISILIIIVLYSQYGYNKRLPSEHHNKYTFLLCAVNILI